MGTTQCKLRKEEQSLAIVKRDDSYLFVPWKNRMVEKIGNMRFILSLNAHRGQRERVMMSLLQRSKVKS